VNGFPTPLPFSGEGVAFVLHPPGATGGRESLRHPTPHGSKGRENHSQVMSGSRFHSCCSARSGGYNSGLVRGAPPGRLSWRSTPRLRGPIYARSSDSAPSVRQLDVSALPLRCALWFIYLNRVTTPLWLFKYLKSFAVPGAGPSAVLCHRIDGVLYFYATNVGLVFVEPANATLSYTPSVERGGRRGRGTATCTPPVEGVGSYTAGEAATRTSALSYATSVERGGRRGRDTATCTPPVECAGVRAGVR